MDIEKIVYLVALAVYGILSTVLSIVRTLKTSKISSEVKAVLPPINVKQPTCDGQPTGLIEDEQPIESDDVQDRQLYSLDEVADILFEYLNRKH